MKLLLIIFTMAMIPLANMSFAQESEYDMKIEELRKESETRLQNVYEIIIRLFEIISEGSEKNDKDFEEMIVSKDKALKEYLNVFEQNGFSKNIEQTKALKEYHASIVKIQKEQREKQVDQVIKSTNATRQVAEELFNKLEQDFIGYLFTQLKNKSLTEQEFNSIVMELLETINRFDTTSKKASDELEYQWEIIDLEYDQAVSNIDTKYNVDIADYYNPLKNKSLTEQEYVDQIQQIHELAYTKYTQLANQADTHYQLQMVKNELWMINSIKIETAKIPEAFERLTPVADEIKDIMKTPGSIVVKPMIKQEYKCGAGTENINGICQVIQNRDKQESTNSKCGAGTEEIDGVCHVIQNNDKSNNNKDFNFFEWVIGLFN